MLIEPSFGVGTCHYLWLEKVLLLTSNSHLFYSLILFPGSKEDTDPRSYCWSVTQAGLEPRSPEPQSGGLRTSLAQPI